MLRADDWMIEHGDCLGFGLESYAETGPRSRNRNVAVQPGITGTPHFAPAARAEQREISYGPSLSPGLSSMGCGIAPTHYMESPVTIVCRRTESGPCEVNFVVPDGSPP